MSFRFSIPIGDWSGDGHGQCDFYTVKANKSVKHAREAYFNAKNILPGILCPEEFCCEYEDSEIPEEVLEEVTLLNDPTCPLNDLDEDSFDADIMAKYVVWFLNKGDPELNAELVKNPPMLPWYGYDKKKRHIWFIGYGLLGA